MAISATLTLFVLFSLYLYFFIGTGKNTIRYETERNKKQVFESNLEFSGCHKAYGKNKCR